MVDRVYRFIISATFTADPLERVFSFWMNEWNLASERIYTPFNQVVQQLLSGSGLFAANAHGANISLIRLEDVVPAEESVALDSDGNGQVARDLITAIKTASTRDSVPHIICICPGAPTTNSSVLENRAHFEKSISGSLGGIAGIHVITPADIQSHYPVNDYHDVVSDSVGLIPYTPLFFAALGTAIIRLFISICRPPYKIVVLDCDQTLWSGVVAEDGPAGLKIDSAHRALQQFVIGLRHQGVLVCLCSKNLEEDIWSVFDDHPDMILKRDHITAWRINWKSKSENLYSLAAELHLGLDSFVFVDDSSIECAEVRANCPEVLVIHLSESGRNKKDYFRNVWAFDQVHKTSEDAQRAQFYKDNLLRDRLSNSVFSFEEFLSKLELEIQFSNASENEIPRMTQLCERISQFNLTGNEWSAAELSRALRESDLQSQVVRVKDRFGDYGIVGLILYYERKESILVDTFLLSCRALGRGVENRMIQRLGHLGHDLNTPEKMLYAIEDPNRIDRPESNGRFQSPASSTENAVTDIWQSVLDVCQIGRNDNFFELGGDSIKAVRIVSRIDDHLEIMLSVSDIFNYPTVSGIAALIDSTINGGPENGIRSVAN